METQENNIAIKMKCKYCGYEWNTLSKLIFVSCPSCMNKNEVTKNGNKEQSN